ncbi:hypothetical protein AVEN_146190-1 [Araneus ventricosus]|uniref:Uncharacterized protein n=1 Tax=Araneus ventricosus TaxID=182803 RepID=A0A4Y2CK45_ARAVE|nr:hypothetical protein AVEN_146190-1 [Araneus ventricosus]
MEDKQYVSEPPLNNIVITSVENNSLRHYNARNTGLAEVQPLNSAGILEETCCKKSKHIKHFRCPSSIYGDTRDSYLQVDTEPLLKLSRVNGIENIHCLHVQIMFVENTF